MEYAMNKDGERPAREAVWLSAWLTVANANDCKKSETPTIWADACLRDFDARFTVEASE